ncbi:HK97-gp10 family putative phage morphogenesis protein [Ruminococcus sp. 210702-SL.1.03]|uniref:HK97-gp10 family putative phage morphogenesis protein n=1 Tax=Ruminococcus sp. 210702-SL.1.03 TaxID=2883233 RepID=UPI001D06654C|nr:HK97-gp10 family putative phage morphogenesis protein [Ruminococcus sp. 210702-SL.1.03]MCB6616163.1 HK97 gp10 family phage protein [Ruminococcus sp. 210702-SL.1.03]
MAKMSIQMPEDLLLKMSKLGSEFDSTAEKVLQAGGEVMLSAVKNSLSAVVGKDTKYPSKSTGELERSLGLSPVLQDKNGDHNIKVGFSEPRSDGGSNAKLASILEYGKSGQPAKPFIKPAKSRAKSAAITAMQNELESEVDKL